MCSESDHDAYYRFSGKKAAFERSFEFEFMSLTLLVDLAVSSASESSSESFSISCIKEEN